MPLRRRREVLVPIVVPIVVPVALVVLGGVLGVYFYFSFCKSKGGGADATPGVEVKTAV